MAAGHNGEAAKLYAERIKKARAAMRARGIDQLLFAHSTDLFYLTGAHGKGMERLTCLFLGLDAAHFIAPAFEFVNLPAHARDLMECHGWKDGDDPLRIVRRIFGARALNIAVGRDVPSWVLLGMQNALPVASWLSADPLMIELRSIKDEYEYRMMKRVQEKSCRALEKLWEHGVAGLSELRVSRLLRDFCEEEGVSCPGGGIASGPHSAKAHHEPTERIIQKGDAVWIDFGGEEPGIGYQSDTTRSFVVGHAPDGFREVYDIVHAANQAVFEAARPGIACEQLDAVAREIISAAGYGEFFPHRVGHGLGLDVHEHPYLAAGNSQIVQAGNAFSDEPGIYLPGRFGIRIEDQLFIHAHGAERMTPLHRDVMIID